MARATTSVADVLAAESRKKTEEALERARKRFKVKQSEVALQSLKAFPNLKNPSEAAHLAVQNIPYLEGRKTPAPKPSVISDDGPEGASSSTQRRTGHGTSIWNYFQGDAGPSLYVSNRSWNGLERALL